MDQKVLIENNHKQQLVGVFNDCRSKALVILCHGYTATKDMDGFIHLTKELNKHKLSTFRFDFSGSGESVGSKAISLKQQAADLGAVIEHFSTYQHIYLLGHSLGVLPALVWAKNKRIAGIISVNGFFLGKIYNQDFNRAYQTLRLLRFVIPRIWFEWKFMIANTDPAKISPPMLLITTKNDEVLDYRQSIGFSKLLKCEHAVETPTLSGHDISATTDSKKIAKIISRWIKGFKLK